MKERFEAEENESLEEKELMQKEVEYQKQQTKFHFVFTGWGIAL